MKRLKRFNESKVEDIDYDYVYECFAELIDENKAEIELIEIENVYLIPSYITLRLITIRKEDRRITNQDNSIGDKKSPIYNYINSHNQNNILLQDLEVGLKRLSDKYPDYNLKFTDYGTSIFIEIFNEKEKEEKYPF
jgi:hypothetical protein